VFDEAMAALGATTIGDIGWMVYPGLLKWFAFARPTHGIM
jgi:hypothetical protein